MQKRNDFYWKVWTMSQKDRSVICTIAFPMSYPLRLIIFLNLFCLFTSPLPITLEYQLIEEQPKHLIIANLTHDLVETLKERNIQVEDYFYKESFNKYQMFVDDFDAHNVGNKKDEKYFYDKYKSYNKINERKFDRYNKRNKYESFKYHYGSHKTKRAFGKTPYSLKKKRLPLLLAPSSNYQSSFSKSLTLFKSSITFSILSVHLADERKVIFEFNSPEYENKLKNLFYIEQDGSLLKSARKIDREELCGHLSFPSSLSSFLFSSYSNSISNTSKLLSNFSDLSHLSISSSSFSPSSSFSVIDLSKGLTHITKPIILSAINLFPSFSSAPFSSSLHQTTPSLPPFNSTLFQSFPTTASCFIKLVLLSQYKSASEIVVVFVQVLDINDHTPYFEYSKNSNVNVEIPESARKRSKYLLPKAYDFDLGTNGVQSYYLILNWYKKNRKNILKTGKGDICKDNETKKPNNFDNTNLAHISNRIIYSNFNKMHTKDEIQHNNRNKNTPFKKKSTDYSTVVVDNKKKTLEMAKIVETFELKVASGDLFLALKKPLDREEIEEYGMTLVAQDGGKIPLRNSVKIVVKVKDINDNSPEFEKATYYFKVMEDTEVLSIIGRMYAQDVDEGRNGNISYSFVHEKPLEDFYNYDYLDDNINDNDFALDDYYDLNNKESYENRNFYGENHSFIKMNTKPKNNVYSYKMANHQNHSHNQYQTSSYETKIKKVNKAKNKFTSQIAENKNLFKNQVIQTNKHSSLIYWYEDYADSRYTRKAFSGNPNSQHHKDFYATNNFHEIQSFFSFSPPWAIDRATGDLILVSQLHYKIHLDNRHNLMVQAVDKGVSGLTGYAQVSIEVVDVNNHAPHIDYNSIYKNKQLNYVPRDYVLSEMFLFGYDENKNNNLNKNYIYKISNVAKGKNKSNETDNGFYDYFFPETTNNSNIKTGNFSDHETKKAKIINEDLESKIRSKESVCFSYYSLPMSILLKNHHIDYSREILDEYLYVEDEYDKSMENQENNSINDKKKILIDKNISNRQNYKSTKAEKHMNLKEETPKKLLSDENHFLNDNLHSYQSNENMPRLLFHQEHSKLIFFCPSDAYKTSQKKVYIKEMENSDTINKLNLERTKKREKVRIKKSKVDKKAALNMLGYLNVEDKDTGLNKLTKCLLTQPEAKKNILFGIKKSFLADIFMKLTQDKKKNYFYKINFSESVKILRSLLKFKLVLVSEDQHELIMMLNDNDILFFNQMVKNVRDNDNENNNKKFDHLSSETLHNSKKITSKEKFENPSTQVFNEVYSKNTANIFIKTNTSKNYLNEDESLEKRLYVIKNLEKIRENKNKKSNKKVFINIKALTQTYFSIKVHCYNVHNATMKNNLKLNFKFYDDVCEKKDQNHNYNYLNENHTIKSETKASENCGRVPANKIFNQFDRLSIVKPPGSV